LGRIGHVFRAHLWIPCKSHAGQSEF
jgi:hypothetical protein